MKKTPLPLALLLLTATLLGGCTSTGEFKGQTTGTGVGLAQNNFKILKTAAKGESSGFKLLGLIPFASPTYAQAKVDLYNSVGESLAGRAVALANQTEDKSSTYLILFSIPKITITADVIEFTDSKK